MNKLLILLGFSMVPFFVTAQTTCVAIVQTARTATTATLSFTLTADSGSPAVADYTIKILPTTGTTGATELTFANGSNTPVLPQLLGNATVTLATGASSVSFSLTLGEVISSTDVIPVALCNSSVVLPVELMDFKGENKGESNMLYWQTASEKNNVGFDVERSTDGSSFQKMGFVKGHGTSVATQTYSFTDEAPLEVTYYRLKQWDENSHFEYSPIISVSAEGKRATSLVLFPNPTSEDLNVKFVSNSTQWIDIELVNTLGQVVQRHSEAAQMGENRFVVPMNGQISGMYTLRLVQGRQVYIRRVCLR